MSDDALRRFFEAAQQDPALAEGARQALGDRPGDAAALAAWARGRGWDVAEADVAAAMAAAEGSLPDDQLDGVAGGSSNAWSGSSLMARWRWG